MFKSIKSTPAYKLYRQSLIYDTVRKHGKVLKRAIKLPRYLGTKYQCPVCGVGLRAFRPMWKSYWRDVKIYQPIHPAESMETLNLEAFTCPRCDAFDRDRLTAIYLEDAFRNFDRNRTYRLLEFAPGDALHKKLKSYPFIAYRSADLSRKTVDECVDMTDMADYADGSLDIILCSHILEHIPDDRKAMRELHRVLKPDGFAIVLVPLVVGLDETHEDTEHGYVRTALEVFRRGRSRPPIRQTRFYRTAGSRRAERRAAWHRAFRRRDVPPRRHRREFRAVRGAPA